MAKSFFSTTKFHKHQTFLVAAITIVAGLIAVPTSAAPVSEKSYIVVLKNSAGDSKSIAADHSKKRGTKISHVYNRAIKGYSALMTAYAASETAKDPAVAFVEEDGFVHTNTTQTGATWGLDRIDQRGRVLDGKFNYVATGNSVKAYVIDTGIRASHTDLAGRVLAGYDAVGSNLPADDCNGHGTHVAGTIGGNTYGVAKNVQLVPVRVLDCSGSGTWSSVIAGIDYVTADHLAGQPAVANMSLGGSLSQAVNLAVSNSIADGVSYAVAAGNNSADACKFSPASVTTAMTIGATDSKDSRASWSNQGKCIDWFAPGVNITSDWFSGDTATAVLSGTSMATPHTTGVAALYLEKSPQSTPQQVRDALFNLTTKNIVTATNSPNSHLLFTNY